jgi:camelysin-like metallo-endopeptidase
MNNETGGSSRMKRGTKMRGTNFLLATMALSALVLIGITSTAGSTTATFTATATNPGNTFATASLVISNDQPNAGDLVNINNLVPGDTAQRVVHITNGGNTGFTYAGVASATANSLLWSDTTFGLQASVFRCNNCTTPANLVYSGALKTLAVPASGTVAAAGSDYLTFVFSLPTTAGNTFQALTQDFTVTYTATQLAGTAR